MWGASPNFQCREHDFQAVAHDRKKDENAVTRILPSSASPKGGPRTPLVSFPGAFREPSGSRPGAARGPPEGPGSRRGSRGAAGGRRRPAGVAESPLSPGCIPHHGSLHPLARQKMQNGFGEVLQAKTDFF